MKKLIVGFVSGLLLLILCGAFFNRYALACELLPAMGYQQIHSHIFVESNMSLTDIEEISQRVTSAAQRITDVYGIPNSKPRMLIVSDAKTSAKWGANDTASMHRSPWGSCIIVGPKGQNIDVIAHEWLHAEIQYRIGFWRFVTQIPTWFDEGAALTLDYRAPFLPENIDLSDEEIVAVKSLRKARDFFSGDIRQHYQAARMAVNPLILNASFYADLERVARGEPFETVFLKRQVNSKVGIMFDPAVAVP